MPSERQRRIGDGCIAMIAAKPALRRNRCCKYSEGLSVRPCLGNHPF